MQIDFLDWLYKWGIYAVMIIGALVVAILARSRLAKLRKMEDRLATPSYEEMDSGIKISTDDEDDS
jgi:hypothetical protein